jgi:APA family basic amino acid/polyamine antiporter
VNAPILRRSIRLPLLTLYGLGTILGAGIYVLIGEVAASAGRAIPIAFLLASVVAGFTALSYAELSARLPRSAGEAAYVDAAFGRPLLSELVGWSVIGMGIVSAATMSRGLVGYLSVFFDFMEAPVLIAIIATLGATAIWGITESLIAAGIVTALEAGGLLLVCVAAGDSLAKLPEQWQIFWPTFDVSTWYGIAIGAFLAFYAFIGFEDIVNVAEEVKSPRTTMPRAIKLSLFISTALYLLVSTVAVLSTPIEKLAGSDAPLAVVMETNGFPPKVIAAISLLAIVNGALIQIVMASRVLYGLASQGLAWPVFARVNSRTQTPVAGTIVVSAAILLLAVFFSLGELSRFTSAVALAIFALVNAALIKLKFEPPAEPHYTAPHFVPVVGLLLCAAMLLYQIYVAIRPPEL